MKFLKYTLNMKQLNLKLQTELGTVQTQTFINPFNLITRAGVNS